MQAGIPLFDVADGEITQDHDVIARVIRGGHDDNCVIISSSQQGGRDPETGIGMPVTQKDVAERAGVTRSVVSHVMHGSGQTIRVNPETAARVRKAAEEMGYQPSALARSFRRQRTSQIGLLPGDGTPMLRFDDGTRYFASLMDGIVEGAFRHQYTLGLCPDLFGPSPESAMADGRFDGFIWYRTFPPVRNEWLKHFDVPIVVIHSKAAAFENRFPTVICDNEQGIRLALEHLASLGHRRISFAYDGQSSFTESFIRADAFLAHGRQMGLDVALVDVHVNGWKPGACYEHFIDYFDRRPLDTALIAHGEQYAIDAMEVAKSRGMRVPDDFSVIGFDSTRYCEYQAPPLTAISQPLVSIGNLAVDLLIQWIDGKKPDPLENVLPCGLDIRGSTGPAARRV
jgi:LacI family transcriptional regulator